MEEIIKYLIGWVVGSEIKARQNRLLENGIRMAALLYRRDDRDEYLNEWKSDMDELGGGALSKIYFVSSLFPNAVLIRFGEFNSESTKNRFLVFLTITLIHRIKARAERANAVSG